MQDGKKTFDRGAGQESCSDPVIALDETQSAAQRELSTRNLERQSEILWNIQAALHRIDEGTYGTCLHCDEEISYERLHAMPWATLCIQCQESADGNQKRSFALK